MVSSEQILRVMTVDCCPLHSVSRPNVIHSLVLSFFCFLLAKPNNLTLSFFLRCALPRSLMHRQHRATMHASTRHGMRKRCECVVPPPVLSSVHPQFAPSYSTGTTRQWMDQYGISFAWEILCQRDQMWSTRVDHPSSPMITDLHDYFTQRFHNWYFSLFIFLDINEIPILCIDLSNYFLLAVIREQTWSSMGGWHEYS